LAVQLEGRDVRTVEGLAPRADELSVLQSAFRRHHALQCGFCTAGILMSAAAFLNECPRPTEQQVREVVGGHLCRCTGYTPIIAAILEAASILEENDKNV
jgi:2-furoyl-CoA dehydrogenase 2Fe-2S iron sulfur subunit